jgi:hypothetical protein
MAKRQKQVMKDHLGPLMVSGTPVNVILKNNAVFLGQVLSVESGSVKLKNTKGHVLHLPFDQVEEIWMEEKVV